MSHEKTGRFCGIVNSETLDPSRWDISEISKAASILLIRESWWYGLSIIWRNFNFFKDDLYFSFLVSFIILLAFRSNKFDNHKQWGTANIFFYHRHKMIRSNSSKAGNTVHILFRSDLKRDLLKYAGFAPKREEREKLQAHRSRSATLPMRRRTIPFHVSTCIFPDRLSEMAPVVWGFMVLVMLRSSCELMHLQRGTELQTEVSLNNYFKE